MWIPNRILFWHSNSLNSAELQIDQSQRTIQATLADLWVYLCMRSQANECRRMQFMSTDNPICESTGICVRAQRQAGFAQELPSFT